MRRSRSMARGQDSSARPRPPAAGADALVQTIRIPGQIAGNGGAPATYRIVVGGVDGTTGSFTVSTYLNAAAGDGTAQRPGERCDGVGAEPAKIPSSRSSTRTTTVTAPQRIARTPSRRSPARRSRWRRHRPDPFASVRLPATVELSVPPERNAAVLWPPSAAPTDCQEVAELGAVRGEILARHRHDSQPASRSRGARCRSRRTRHSPGSSLCMPR